MSNIFLIRLRPLEPFFFGGANHFSAGADKNKVNYLSQSEYFPQQSALLGMLRYQLLEQEGLLPLSNRNRGTAKSLIGDESFQAAPDEQQSPDTHAALKPPFGKILRLSPVFIQRVVNDTTVQRIFRDALDGFEDDNKALHRLQLDTETVQVSFDRNVWQDYAPAQPPFSGKHAPEAALIDWATNRRIPLGFDPKEKTGLFIEDWRVGIVKKNREEAFYKQCFYRFATPHTLADNQHERCKTDGYYCFAFYVELDASIQLAPQSIVQLGGDRSAFAMTTVQVNHEKPNPFTQPESFYGNLYHQGDRSLDKLVLLSDARVNADLFQHLAMASVDGRNFRNIRASVSDTMQYGPLPSKERSIQALLDSALKKEIPVRGEPYYLMSAGSVLYSGNMQAVKSALDEFPHFTTIGYNHYLFIPKSST